MSGFHFCPGTILEKYLGSRDTPSDITVKKTFSSKILKAYRSIERSQKTEYF